MWKLTLLSLMALPAILLHEGGLAGAHIGILLAVCGAALIYAKGLVAIHARRDGAMIADAKRFGAFAAALALIWIALAPPVEHIGRELFSAHMTQHLALVMICAPLLALGRPGEAFLWALPMTSRRWVARRWGGAAIAPFRALFGSPAAVWISFVGLFAFWHLPGPYAYALGHEAAHVAEHLCLLLSAYGFWAIAFGFARRLSLGARFLFVVSAALLSALPGALISISSRPFYAVHASSVARFGLTALEDQQIAGLVMWIPAGFIYLAAILWLLLEWLRASERRSRRWRPPALALLLTGLSLGSCDDGGAGAQLDRIAMKDIPGDPAQGAREIEKIGCGACHTIPGILGAQGLVGPPLDRMGRRIYVAGLLRNTPENLARWIRRPQSFVPGNAMPDMDLSEEQSRDISAYLSTLR